MGDDKFIDKSVSDESATPQQQWAADDKAKANGNADWKPTPKQLAQRDEFAGRFAKLCAEKKRKAEQAETKAEAEGERHLLIDPDDLDTVISTKWLIDGLVPLQEISLVFGPPKNLKTFLVLALLLCVATGREFFGRKVHRAKVLYIIGEGTNAFLGRIKAWQKLNDVPSLEKHFKYDRRMINLFADDGVDCVLAVFLAMQAQGFRPDVVAIDTLGRAMGGAKETTEDFNKIFATLDAMAQDYWPGVTLVIVSHTRKADMTYRGPQVIAADCDNMIYVERLEKELKANVHCQFFRNAAEFDDFGFTCAPEEVTTDIGPQDFLTVAALTAPKAGTENKADKDEELIWRTLLNFYQGDNSWTKWGVWFEAAKLARGKLGNSHFSGKVKSLLEKGWVRVNDQGLYQVVFGGQGSRT
jgi:hypothetical protein